MCLGGGVLGCIFRPPPVISCQAGFLPGHDRPHATPSVLSSGPVPTLPKQRLELSGAGLRDGAVGRGQGRGCLGLGVELAGNRPCLHSCSRDSVSSQPAAFPISISAVLEFWLSWVMGRAASSAGRVGPGQLWENYRMEGRRQPQQERIWGLTVYFRPG